MPRVTLSNNGTGPAIIRKFTIKLNDEEIPRSDEKSAAAIAFEGFDFGAPYEVNPYRPHKRDAIAPGKAFK